MRTLPARVLVLGCGSVAQCTVPLLIRDLPIDPAQVTVVDYLDNRNRIAGPIAQGVTYECDRLTRGEPRRVPLQRASARAT